MRRSASMLGGLLRKENAGDIARLVEFVGHAAQYSRPDGRVQGSADGSSASGGETQSLGQTRRHLSSHGEFGVPRPRTAPCAKRRSAPLGFRRLWVFPLRRPPAPRIRAPSPPSSRSVSRRAAKNAKGAEAMGIGYWLFAQWHNLSSLSPLPSHLSPSPRTFSPPAFRARVVESSPRRVVETCFLRQPDNHDSSTHHQSPPP